jgi:hypothetical protein
MASRKKGRRGSCPAGFVFNEKTGRCVRIPTSGGPRELGTFLAAARRGRGTGKAAKPGRNKPRLEGLD